MGARECVSIANDGLEEHESLIAGPSIRQRLDPTIPTQTIPKATAHAHDRPSVNKYFRGIGHGGNAVHAWMYRQQISHRPTSLP